MPPSWTAGKGTSKARGRVEAPQRAPAQVLCAAKAHAHAHAQAHPLGGLQRGELQVRCSHISLRSAALTRGCRCACRTKEAPCVMPCPARLSRLWAIRGPPKFCRFVGLCGAHVDLSTLQDLAVASDLGGTAACSR